MKSNTLTKTYLLFNKCTNISPEWDWILTANTHCHNINSQMTVKSNANTRYQCSLWYWGSFCDSPTVQLAFHCSCFLMDQKWCSLSLCRPLWATLAFPAGACRGIRGVRSCDGTVNSNYSEALASVRIPWCQENSAGVAGVKPALESPEDPLGRWPSVLIRLTHVHIH